MNSLPKTVVGASNNDPAQGLHTLKSATRVAYKWLAAGNQYQNLQKPGLVQFSLVFDTHLFACFSVSWAVISHLIYLVCLALRRKAPNGGSVHAERQTRKSRINLNKTGYKQKLGLVFANAQPRQQRNAKWGDKNTVDERQFSNDKISKIGLLKYQMFTMHIIIDKFWILECQTSRPTAVEKNTSYIASCFEQNDKITRKNRIICRLKTTSKNEHNEYFHQNVLDRLYSNIAFKKKRCSPQSNARSCRAGLLHVGRL